MEEERRKADRIAPESESLFSHSLFAVSGFILRKKWKKQKNSWSKVCFNCALSTNQLREYVAPFPVTKKQKRAISVFICEPTVDNVLTINRGVCIRDGGGGILLAFFKNIIPLDVYTFMESTTVELVAAEKPFSYKQEKRGKGEYFPFRLHRAFRKEAMPFAYTNSDAWVAWINKIRPYFSLVEAYTHKNFPMMDKIHSDAFSHNPLRPFTSGQINWNTQVQPHRDTSDFPSSVCCVTTLGAYTGGEIFIHDFELKVNIQPGDLLFFQGTKLKHSVKPFGGVRSSIALYTSAHVIIT